MATEIERKFLATGRPWEGLPGVVFVQGYLAVQDGVAVRVRQKAGGARLTVKGPARGAQGATRAEFEWDVADDDVEALLALCGDRVVNKRRHRCVVGSHTWEIDVFAAPHEGLVLAEIELSREDEPFERPAWLGEEVTSDGRYANAWLAANPGVPDRSLRRPADAP